MAKVLFLGNSHVSAYKLAYDALGSARPFEAAFFCAMGADLAFTAVRDEALAPADHADVERDELAFFFPEAGPAVIDTYVQRRRPSDDVGRQFRTTGGAAQIDLRGVSDIVYVAGASPYDFRRLGEVIAPLSDTLRRELLGRLLGSRFLLRAQVAAIRALAPQVRHHFVGAPLQHVAPMALSPALRQVIAYNRETVARLAGGFLFDSVFQPGPSVLADDLVSTRAEFFTAGRQQSEAYQGLAPTKADTEHVNGDYARLVIAEFLVPALAA